MNQITYVIWQEEEGWVSKCLTTGVTSCGDTQEEAIKNLKEALELYLEDQPEANYKRDHIQFGSFSVHA
ncbi:MAG TPA: type II toxin-antitoxin system HicB family antitoxin [Candidatus Gracilibacteria bacterium]